MENDNFNPDDYIHHFENQLAKEKEGKKKVGRFIIGMLILSLVAAPLLGLGLSLGIQIADGYILPRMLNDAAQRENFSFENVHTPIGYSQNSLAQRQDYVQLVDAVKPSVVTISAVMPQTGNLVIQGRSQARAGTGILMYETSSRYYVATNAHVIEGASNVRVSIEGSPYIYAMPIGRDDGNDLAVIAIYKADAVQAGVHAVTLAHFGDSSQSRVGEVVLAIGNAMGEGITVTNGIVSALNIQISVEGRFLDVLQTNAAINRGNSGGPLINIFGEVIGINTAKYNEQVAQGMGYAIPTHIAKPILEGIIRGDSATSRRPSIGITVDNRPWNTTEANDLRNILSQQGHAPQEIVVPNHGLLVAQISADSPAYIAGMQVHDIITAIGGHAIYTFEDLVEIMYTRSRGETVVFSIIRGGLEAIEMPITLGAYITQAF